MIPMKHLYGEWTQEQISLEKKSLRGSIFFLLICVDPNTSHQLQEVDVNKPYENLLYKLGGLNDLLMQQIELEDVMSLLDAAKLEYNKPEFEYKVYRKLILDAGAEIAKLKEVDDAFLL